MISVFPFISDNFLLFNLTQDEGGPSSFDDVPSSPKSPLSPKKPWQRGNNSDGMHVSTMLEVNLDLFLL